MDSEETPLLNEQIKHDTIYDHFSAKQKLVIMSLVCWCGLLPRKAPLLSRTRAMILYLSIRLWHVYASHS